MAINYKEGSKNCIGAQEALSGACCRGQGDILSSPFVNSPSYPTPSSSVGSQQQPAAGASTAGGTANSPSSANNTPSSNTSANSPSSPTKITVTVTLKQNSTIAAEPAGASGSNPAEATQPVVESDPVEVYLLYPSDDPREQGPF